MTVTPAQIAAMPAVKLFTDPSLSSKHDAAAQFVAGSKESLKRTDPADWDLSTGDFSIGVAVYRDSTGVQPIASKYEDATNYWKLEIDGADKAHFIAVVGGSTTIEVTGTTALSSTGTWYFLDLVVDRSAAATTFMFLDGADDTAGTPTVSVNDIDNTGDLQVGQFGVHSRVWTQIGGDGINGSWGSGYAFAFSMAVIGSTLYVGLGVDAGDAEVWAFTSGSWTKIGGDGVNSSWSAGIEVVESLVAMGTTLYAGLGTSADDAEVWEFAAGSWTQIGGDGLNGSWDTTYERVESLAVMGTTLYAGLGSGSGDAKVWKFTSGSWSKIGGDGTNGSWSGSPGAVESLAVIGSTLYAGIGTSNGEVWEFAAGSWTRIGGSDGINGSWTTGYEAVLSMAVIGTTLYAGLGITNSDGEVWKLISGSWTKVGGDGLNGGWGSGYEKVQTLLIGGGALYAGLASSANDAEVWQFISGSWTKVGGDGVNSSWSAGFAWVFSLAMVSGIVYAGLGSGTHDGDVWQFGTNVEYWDGRIDSLYGAKGALLTAAEVAWKYNLGAGKTYDGIVNATGDGVGIDAKLTAWYDLSENSGTTRFDAKSDNHLTVESDNFVALLEDAPNIGILLEDNPGIYLIHEESS